MVRIPVAELGRLVCGFQTTWNTLEYGSFGPLRLLEERLCRDPRMDDVTTGVLILIEAGLGSDGTLAASELIISDGLSTHLAHEPSCRDKRNFEAVIETQIIDTKSGP